MKYAQLFAEVYNTPHMIHPGKAELIESVFRGYAMGSPPEIDAAINYRRDEQSNAKPYEITNGGVAVIPVLGTLRNRVSGMSAWSGMAGYQHLAARVESAAMDGDVTAIMLDMDTPGGSVAGMFQFTDKLREMAAVKPIWSHSNESAFSAGYAIASATSRILGARTSDVGSIGVIAMVAEQTGWDKKTGVKYQTVYAGARKNDFNPHEPMKAEAVERLQVEVDQLYSMFVEHVEEGRPMTEQAIRDTEAGIFSAKDAQDIGLLDDIMNFEDAVHELEQYASSGRSVTLSQTPVSAGNNQPKGESMTDKSKPAENTTAITQAAHDAAVQNASAEGIAEGKTQGAEAERTRIGAILQHENAEGRREQAEHIAFNTSMSVDDAGAMLATSAATKPAAAEQKGSQFDKLMSGMNPDLDADGGETETNDDAALVASMIAMNHKSMGVAN